MWCLALEITMTVSGVIILILGKLYLSSEMRLTGWRARVAGLMMLLPLPLVLGLATGLGFLQGLEVIPDDSGQYLTIFEYILFPSMAFAVVLLAIFSRPRQPSPSEAATAKVQANLADAKHWFDLGYDGLAIDSLKAALRADPYSLETYERMAEIYTYKKDWDNAARAIQSALELNPRSATNHFRVSLCYGNLGRNDLAERERKIALQLDPSFSTSAEITRMQESYSLFTNQQGESK